MVAVSIEKKPVILSRINAVEKGCRHLGVVGV
jgi:hypothetical protein